MPIHDLGYRNWDVGRSRSANRWMVIARTGVRQALKSHWVRRMIFFSWLPALVMGGFFFAYEQAMENVRYREPMQIVLRQMMGQGRREIQRRMGPRGRARELQNVQVRGLKDVKDLPTLQRLAQQAEAERRQRELERRESDTKEFWAQESRHKVWCYLMLTFFRAPQLVLMVLLMALVAPSLIAQDIRSRAFLIYFSRPLNPRDYVIGKSAILWFFLICVTTAPALLLYVLGVALSNDMSVLGYTWDIPLRILAASAVVIIPTSSLALCLSSMTSETRFAAYGWLSIWAMGMVSYVLLEGQSLADGDSGPSQWTLISLYHTMGRVQSWIFGLSGSQGSVLPSVLLLGIMTVVTMSVLLRRVTSPIRV